MPQLLARLKIALRHAGHTGLGFFGLSVRQRLPPYPAETTVEGVSWQDPDSRKTQPLDRLYACFMTARITHLESFKAQDCPRNR